MNENKPQSATDSAAAALEARIVRIRQTLFAQQQRLARGSRLTAIIGSLLIVAMAVYFYVFYVQIREVMTPRAIVDAAESVVVNALPDARRALESQINSSAAEWAAGLSMAVQDNIPSVRGEIEDQIMVKAGEALDQLQVLTGQRFRQFVGENRPMLSDGFKSLKNREEADQFVADLHTALARNMAGDMREQSEEMMHYFYQLNHKLNVLKEGKGLKGEQPLEREILMIAKRLQRDSADDMMARPRGTDRVRRLGTADDPTDEPGTATSVPDKPAGDNKATDAGSAPPADDTKTETGGASSSGN